MSDQNIYFECECYSDEHRLVFKFFNDPEDLGELYVSTFLGNWRPGHKRIWIAIKYAFGYTSKYGHFDSFSMNPEDRNKFYTLAKKYKEFHDEK